MKLKDGRNLYFGIAYWKKRWVSVPFFYLPDDAVTETGELARFKFIPQDKQKIEPIAKRENKALEKVPELVKETIVPWLLSDKKLKQLCRKNDLPLAWVTDRFPQRTIKKLKGVNRLENRKYPSLKSNEFRQIRKQLNKLYPQVGLIVSILWYLNNILGKGGSFVTLEEILRLQVQDISPESEASSNWINLNRPGQFVVHCLPTQLWKSLCRQINDNSMFVFSNKYGGPLLSTQIDGYIKKAAKKVGFKESVTSLFLRPQFNKKKVERVAKKYNIDASVKNYLEPISLEKWDVICKQIPKILERKGRKFTHDPFDILNAILYRLRTRCSIRKLPSHFPPWRAVDSQYRRWKKTGIFEEILNLLK
ncbi:hypothetical protein LCGC14_1785420 [marine sediment metagenome]|uniref:Insertion element IS402-like domain-containing protein n=1 Tax=marine sediment metagenome TaxID=412755 RepID=A0A0F9GU62_9ZZZZ|nr:hypothetical protein [Candidatus Anoxychlamydiales bacterium]